MTRFVQLSVFVCTFFAIAFAAPGNRRKSPNNITVDCSNYDDLDKHGQILGIYGDRVHRAPANRIQLETQFCPMLKNAERTIKAYARQCFKPFPKQLIGLSLYGTSRQTKKVCDTEAGIVEFLRHSQCVAKATAEQMETSHACMDEQIRATESTRDSVTDLNLKLPYTCCNFHTFKNCVRKTNLAFCPADAVKYAIDAIEDASFEVLDMICKGWEDGSEGCAKLPKLKLAAKPVDRSILPASVEIFTNL